MERGDIFHDGLLGYWILHEKPNGKKLFLYPFDMFMGKDEKINNEFTKGCDCWHDPKTWNLDTFTVICNLYKDEHKAKSLLNDGNTLKDKFLSVYDSMKNQNND